MVVDTHGSSAQIAGGSGGSSALGGAGGSGGNSSVGQDGAANSGSGGGGAGSQNKMLILRPVEEPEALFLRLLANPSAIYSYVVGSGGAGWTLPTELLEILLGVMEPLAS